MLFKYFITKTKSYGNEADGEELKEGKNCTNVAFFDEDAFVDIEKEDNEIQ